MGVCVQKLNFTKGKLVLSLSQIARRRGLDSSSVSFLESVSEKVKRFQQIKRQGGTAAMPRSNAEYRISYFAVQNSPNKIPGPTSQALDVESEFRLQGTGL